ncbi:hypothetical protein GCM10010488_25800 [Oerskovia jenensis]
MGAVQVGDLLEHVLRVVDRLSRVEHRPAERAQQRDEVRGDLRDVRLVVGSGLVAECLQDATERRRGAAEPREQREPVPGRVVARRRRGALGVRGTGRGVARARRGYAVGWRRLVDGRVGGAALGGQVATPRPFPEPGEGGGPSEGPDDAATRCRRASP